jgi:N-acetylglucosamine-6-phosphate deacetylase
LTAERVGFRGRLILPDGIMEDGLVLVQDERIEYVGPPVEDDRKIVQTDGFIWPGLIDVHIHGAGGADVMDGTPAALETISQTLVHYGVTGFLATTLTMDKPSLEQAVTNVVQMRDRLQGAQVLGIHMEGPWICPEFRGAQNPRYIRDPHPDDADWAIEVCQGLLRLVTLAPERPRALDFIGKMVGWGVTVSVGHTGAAFEEVQRAVDIGASHVTHCFNGMTGLHHRRPGAAGAALLDDRLTVECICDGLHVHPAVAKLLAKIKGKDRLILISDGMRAIGQPEGRYELGGLPVEVKNGQATLEDGSLAGSLLTLDEAVRNMAQFADIPLWEAVRMASLAPAKRLGLEEEIGSLETGKKADLVVTDEACRVKQVWIQGKPVWKQG